MGTAPSPSKRRRIARPEAPANIAAETFKWTLTTDAIALCFLRDVLNMRENDAKGNFFWLGRVPCRRVSVAGIVVGVQTYEKRTIYSVDDGTAVIECVLHHAPPRPPSPLKPEPKSKSKYDPPPDPPIEPPAPVADVGASVTVVGRVIVKGFKPREITADNIEPCLSSNAESHHWINVARLHREYYDAALGPFVIPEPRNPHPHPPTPAAGAPPTTSSPSTIVVPQTPSRSRTHAASVSGPSQAGETSSVAGSPSKDRATRLRHPSRLHTRDLTANLFKIYVKYYMDNAPAGPSQSFDEPTTPTQPRTFDLATPRPRRTLDTDQTPQSKSKGKGKAPDNDQAGTQGFTLSHLRRVPALALLAARVVDAERRRREKARKEKDAKDAKDGKARSGEPARMKAKRLFQHAVRKLHEEGAIVLWDGPVRALWGAGAGADEGLWKAGGAKENAGDTTASTVGDASMWSAYSAASSSSHSHTSSRSVSSAHVPLASDARSASVSDADDPGALSDAGTEEAYVPLTHALLAPALRALLAPEAGAEPPARACAELQRALVCADERWARLGEWSVQETLGWMAGEGLVWDVGGGRWELCL